MTTKMTIAVSRVDWHDQVHDYLKAQFISPSIPYKWLASLILGAIDLVLNRSTKFGISKH